MSITCHSFLPIPMLFCIQTVPETVFDINTDAQRVGIMRNVVSRYLSVSLHRNHSSIHIVSIREKSIYFKKPVMQFAAQTSTAANVHTKKIPFI